MAEREEVLKEICSKQRRIRMRLSDQEKKMLDGKEGFGCQKAMEILVGLGEIYGCETMIPVKSAHISGSSYKGSGSAGSRFVTSLAEGGGRFKVPSTLNPLSLDLDNWKELGFSEKDCKNQLATVEAYGKMGCSSACTCTPYLAGKIPAFGDHIAWSESSALIFANSVLGARTNREGGVSALASGLTGRTPLYGFHTEESRRATVLVENKACLEADSDYSALGYHLGNLLGGDVPFLAGFGRKPTVQALKAFSAGISTCGNVSLFHLEGVTPESGDPKIVSRRIMNGKIVVSNEDLEAVYRKLSGTAQCGIDYVAIGCPHLGIEEMREVAVALEKKGRRIDPRVKFWVFTSREIKARADELGYSRRITEMGGEIICNTCVVSSHMENFGLRYVATNSAKAAHYMPSLLDFQVFFGTLEECTEAAIRGRWSRAK